MSSSFEYDAFNDEADRHGGPTFIDRTTVTDQRGGSVDQHVNQPVDVPEMHEDGNGKRASVTDQPGGSVDHLADAPDMHEHGNGNGNGKRASVTGQLGGSVVQPVDAVDKHEDDIGDIILKAQRFAEVTAIEAQNRAQATVQSAQAHAARIVREAELHASSIASQHQPMVPRDDVADLCGTIDRFARSNEELVGELAQLRAALAAGWIEPQQSQRPA
jgi:hypothetical protein